jgi:hypothetical protein
MWPKSQILASVRDRLRSPQTPPVSASVRPRTHWPTTNGRRRLRGAHVGPRVFPRWRRPRFEGILGPA